MAAVLICSVAVLWFLYFIIKGWRKCRLPPGPKGIPIFGNVLQMDLRKFSTEMSQIGKHSGDEHSVKLFFKTVVILNSYKSIKEAMTSHKYSETFSGRPKTFVGEYLAKNDVGLSTYSKEWMRLRKIVHRGLRTYGTHLAEVEKLVQAEIKHMTGRIQKHAGTPVDPKDYIDKYVASILAMLLTGRHHESDDPFLDLCCNLSERVDYLLSPDVSELMSSMPWLRTVPIGCGKVYQESQQLFSDVKKIVFEGLEIKDRRTSFFEYMVEQKSQNGLDDATLNGTMFDMVVGGTGTSRTTLYSLLLILAANPKIQIKVQEEIDNEIGPSRLPCIEDKPRMPYTHAVILELFRHFPAGPMGVPHCTMEDTEFKDYYFPKDTVIFCSIWGVLHDETFWEDPWTFNPSRFLDDNGHLVPPEDEKRRRLITFGVGKRQCVGEILARLRIFLAFVAILQKFTLLPDPDNSLPEPDPRTFDAHLFLTAPRYKIVFEPRVIT